MPTLLQAFATWTIRIPNRELKKYGILPQGEAVEGRPGTPEECLVSLRSFLIKLQGERKG